MASYPGLQDLPVEVRGGLVEQSAPSPSLTPLALTHKGKALNSMFVCFSMFGRSPN